MRFQSKELLSRQCVREGLWRLAGWLCSTSSGDKRTERSQIRFSRRLSHHLPQCSDRKGIVSLENEAESGVTQSPTARMRSVCSANARAANVKLAPRLSAAVALLQARRQRRVRRIVRDVRCPSNYEPLMLLLIGHLPVSSCI